MDQNESIENIVCNNNDELSSVLRNLKKTEHVVNVRPILNIIDAQKFLDRDIPNDLEIGKGNT